VDWSGPLRDAHCVLHIAGKAHTDPRGDTGKQAEFRRVNVQATVALARAAINAGTRRLVLVSSIGVNGSCTQGHPFTEADAPAPTDFYAVTKFEAEEHVRSVCGGSSMEVVIVRPALVAGAGAPGSLARLAGAVRARAPLPFSAIHNQRSLVGVRSLAALLELCCRHPAAAGRLFLAADSPPLSSAEIISEIAAGLAVRPMLLSVPVTLLKAIAAVLGRSREVSRLCDSLVVSSETAQTLLGWHAEVPIRDELRELGAAARTDA